ncbi:MAG TPA: hypothetical protein DEA80_21075 [Afipia sp.]|uniref:hypothetical protein n=1 Tax=unclassified Afipia TaxID=2642050 RepID=UPI00046575F9|nr:MULTISPECIES: hypothetical protein [unclassified Afipia]HAO42177.1 hypothetical protein [Afipia sp.]HBF53239.1 hypothetical protein [Afipia sp.]HBR47378.1 hypothetical protein [Afipia sp.]HCX16824.1 hypothetical protein [Afipia sp.]|tara:strand:- start:314 stop:538 length:225 start_codon:yes stop_codon:yes gene_type:complete
MTTTFVVMGPRFRGDDIVGAAPLRLAQPDLRQFAFTLFVDAIFTTLLEALFTNAFDVIARFQARACVLRAGRCD